MSLATEIAGALATASARNVGEIPLGKVPATSARGFNGTSQYLSGGDVLDAGNTNFGVWITFKLGDTSGSQWLIGKYDNVADEREYSAWMSTGSPKASFSTNGTSAGVTTITSTPSISDGAWTDLLIWHDADANQIGILRVGAAAVTASFSSGVHSGPSPFVVAAAGSFTLHANVDVANVAFFRDPVISWSAIATMLTNGGRGLLYTSLSAAEKNAIGLVSWWDNQEQGITDNAADKHGSNTLTQTASPTVETGPG